MMNITKGNNQGLYTNNQSVFSTHYFEKFQDLDRGQNVSGCKDRVKNPRQPNGIRIW